MAKMPSCYNGLMLKSRFALKRATDFSRFKRQIVVDNMRYDNVRKVLMPKSRKEKRIFNSLQILECRSANCEQFICPPILLIFSHIQLWFDGYVLDMYL